MLVGAFAVAHTPQLLARPDTEDRDLVLRVHAAFARVKRRGEALRPDAIAMIAAAPIEAPLARGILEQDIERGFDLFYTQHAPLDYEFYVPLHFTMPEPVVPL